MCKAPRFDVCPTPAAAIRPSSIEQYSSQLRRAMVGSSWYACSGSTAMLSVKSQSLTEPLADPESSCCGFPLVDGRNDLLSTISEIQHYIMLNNITPQQLTSNWQGDCVHPWSAFLWLCPFSLHGQAANFHHQDLLQPTVHQMTCQVNIRKVDWTFAVDLGRFHWYLDWRVRHAGLSIMQCNKHILVMFIGVPREKSHWKSWQSNPPDQTFKVWACKSFYLYSILFTFPRFACSESNRHTNLQW